MNQRPIAFLPDVSVAHWYANSDGSQLPGQDQIKLFGTSVVNACVWGLGAQLCSLHTLLLDLVHNRL